MKILIADDNDNNRVLQKTVLEAHGHTVNTAANGAEALEAARRDMPDILVSDILMPEMDGFELCRSIREDEQLKHLPVLLMTTTYTEEGDEQLALDIGATRFVIRPADAGEFIRIVEEVYREHAEKGPMEVEKPEEVLKEEHERAVGRKLDKKVRELEAERSALKESEGRYRRLVEGLKENYFFYSHDTRGFFTYLSPSITNVLGYSQSEFKTHYTEYLTDNPKNMTVRRIAELAMKGEEQQPFEIEVFHKDGTRRWLELKETPIVDDAGSVVSVEGIAHDITLRKESEDKIRLEVELNRNLLKISEATAKTTDVERLMGEVVRAVRVVTASDICASYLLDSEIAGYIPSTSDGISRELIPMFRSSRLGEHLSIVKRSKEEEGPVVVGAAPGEPCREIEELRGVYWVRDVRTIAIIPLMRRDACLGFLLCLYGNENRKAATGFTERDLELMRSIAQQVSMAVEEANLYNDSTDKTMELMHTLEVVKTMHEIDRSILSSLDTQEILDTSINMITKIMACDCASTLLETPEGDGLRLASGFAANRRCKVGDIVQDTLAIRVLQTLRPEYISSEAAMNAETDSFCTICKSRMVVPLVVAGKPAGVISVGSRRTAAYTPNEISILEDIAVQMGVALGNARHVEELERDMKVSSPIQ